MKKMLHVLILEDNPQDAEIIQDIIINAGIDCKFYFAINRQDFLKGIAEFSPDIVLSDNALPQFDSEEALFITRQKFPYVPFILVTGTVSEEYAVKITKSGADDYILKDRLARLPAAIDAALQHRKAEQLLRTASFEKEMMALRMAAILNTIPANIALLDKEGFIIEVNNAWKKFADENGNLDNSYGIGLNYVHISKNTIGSEMKNGITVARGIQCVLKNILSEFVFEYPCHSANTERWFRMIATPLSGRTGSGVVVMHIDITEIKNLERDRLNNKIKEQRKITKAILHAQEEERNVIGRELHDNVNQILAGTKLILSTAQIYPGKKEEIIQKAVQNLQDAINENRKIAHQLVAPDFKEIKITEQLTILVEGMLKRAGIAVKIETKGFREDALDDEQKLTIYRVAQEQCTNILKHAVAKVVSLSLTETDDVLTMKIADDGKGMEKGELVKGIGLRNIKSRLELFNGTVNTETSPGKGFIMKITIPLRNSLPIL